MLVIAEVLLCLALFVLLINGPLIKTFGRTPREVLAQKIQDRRAMMKRKIPSERFQDLEEINQLEAQYELMLKEELPPEPSSNISHNFEQKLQKRDLVDQQVEGEIVEFSRFKQVSRKVKVD